MLSIDNEMTYFGPAENWFWVLRCDEEGRKPDVCRVLMWVSMHGKIIGMIDDAQRPGKITEPVCWGAYKHLNDLALDEREILAETTRVPDVDEDQISKGAWLSYLRFEVINGDENTVVAFSQLTDAEKHFHKETKNAYKLGGRCVLIKLVAVIRTGILADLTGVPDVDEEQTLRGAWLSYVRFEMINDHENTVAEFLKLADAEKHFQKEGQKAQKLGVNAGQNPLQFDGVQ